ncbi:MAG: tetratricopeptide repeat protein, partial [Anaerolineales bacterium]
IIEVSQDCASVLQESWGIPEFQVRVGINTGLAAIGGITEREDTVMGGTVNLGARLESAAPPGGVLISHETYRHVRGVFDVEPQEPITVKGFSEPVNVYIVRGIKPRALRRGTRGVEGVETRMVGREAELRYLQGALNSAIQDREGQVVTILGEAGVGKSRLLYEFKNWIDLQPEQIRQYQGRARPETQGLPYTLLRDMFTFSFQIQEDDPADIVRNNVEDGFGEIFGYDEQGEKQAHLIGELLGYDFHASRHLEELIDDPQGLRDLGLKYFGEYFQSVSEMVPAVIFLEDIHWADDSSLDVINQLGHQAVQQHLMVVCLTRHSLYEHRPYWGEGKRAHHRLDLEPLSKWDSRQLVDEILQRVEQIPAALRELVVSHAEGNPFYIEELIKMLIDDGVIVKGEEQWHVEPLRLAEIDVPSTLRGVLQARLDSLPSLERLILQQASVVGRTFWDRAVAYLHSTAGDGASEEEVPPALAALRQRELIFRREDSAFTGAGEYIFKHALLRDVIYESVLKRTRREYHGQVAQWLIENSGERAGEHTGLIADHLERAGQRGKAVVYLNQAGGQAARKYANKEAVDYFSRAVALTPEDDLAARYDLLMARERAWEIQGQRESQQQDIAELKKIADQLKEVEKQAQVATRQIVFFNRTGNFPATLETIEEAIKLARKANDTDSEATLYMQWGVALWRQGRYTSATTLLKQAMAMAQSADLELVEVDGIRTLGPAFAETLADEQGKVLFEQALEKYRQVGDRRGEAHTLNNLGAYYSEIKRSFSKAREYYEAALPIWREIGDRRGEGLTVYNLGVNAFEHDDFTTAVKWLPESLEIRRQVGDRWGQSKSHAYLGQCYFHLGEYHLVLAQYNQALSISQEIGDRKGENWALGLLGNFYRDLGDHTQARSYYRQVLGGGDEIDQPQDRANILFNLGLLLHQMEDFRAALERVRQGLEIYQDQDYSNIHWLGLTCKAHILTAIGDLNDAQKAYQEVTSKDHRWRKPLFTLEAMAGLARTLIAQGKTKEALQRVEKVISHIGTSSPTTGTLNNLNGALEPMRIYLTCYQVLSANQDSRAEGILRQANDLIQERASKIQEEGLRRSYLSNVPANRELVSEYEKVGK